MLKKDTRAPLWARGRARVIRDIRVISVIIRIIRIVRVIRVLMVIRFIRNRLQLEPGVKKERSPAVVADRTVPY